MTGSGPASILPPGFKVGLEGTLRDRFYDLTMIALFVAIPELLLILSLKGVRSMCHELSNRRFFEPSGESISWQLLVLVGGIGLIRLL